MLLQQTIALEFEKTWPELFRSQKKEAILVK